MYFKGPVVVVAAAAVGTATSAGSDLKRANTYRPQPSFLGPSWQRLLPPLCAPCDSFKTDERNVSLLAEIRFSRA